MPRGRRAGASRERRTQQQADWVHASHAILLIADRSGSPPIDLVPQSHFNATVSVSAHPRRSAQLERGTGCVLVADDNRDSADSLALLLRAAGYECVVAYSGSEAWEIAARRHPQVMLLDIGMPGLNGYDVARRTRPSEWGNAALLIAATGWGQAGDLSEAKEAGFDQHFTKPVSVDRLLHLLAEFSRIRQASAKSTVQMSRSSSTA
jgi:CheY-like chemotaxis protein